MPRKKTVKKASKKSILDLVLPDFARYFLIFAIVGVLLLFLWVISPFFNVLIYSGLIAIVFYPLHKLILKWLKGRKSIAAVISTMLVVTICLAPLTLFMIFIAQEAVDTYGVLETKIEGMDLEAINGIEDLPWIGETLNNWSYRYGFKEFIQQADVNVFEVVQNVGEAVSSFVFNQSASIAKSLGDTAVSLFILLLTVFFFFRDGGDVTAFMKKMSPLPMKHENEIEKKLKGTTYAIVVGNFGTAILQGLAGAIGFWIAGVEHVVLWGTVMAFASLIPYIGASIIWAPVAAFFLLQGDVVWGTFLVLWGLVVVSAVDNIARPYLIGSTSKMHPLATFLVVLGGIYVFGLKGIIFGPLILSLTVTIIHIYEMEYKEVLKV
jgi:predicted PurR-regulated permease PerM